MSTKTFCDGCGAEITDGCVGLYSTPGGVQFSIQGIGFNKSNEGDVCKYCVLDAVNMLDDRPQPYPEKPRETGN